MCPRLSYGCYFLANSVALMSYLNKLTCLAWVLHAVATKAVDSNKMSARGSWFCLLNGDCSLKPRGFYSRSPGTTEGQAAPALGTAAPGFARPGLNWWEETQCKTQQKPRAKAWGPGWGGHADTHACSSVSPRPLAAQRELKKHNPDSRKQQATSQNSIPACCKSVVLSEHGRSSHGPLPTH